MIKIIKQPASLTIREGSNASFRVYIEYIPDPEDSQSETRQIKYQWFYSTDGGFIFNPSSEQSDQAVRPNIDGRAGSTLTIRNVPPGLSNAIFKCTITDGLYEVDTIGVILFVISNEELTANFKMEYTSLFTGEEIDEAIRKMLGDKYDHYIMPGTRLIGRYYDEPADLNDLTVPGVYTAHFYRNAPTELQENNGTTPIQISVFTSEDYEYSGVTSLFQTITTLTYATEDMNSVGITEGSSLLYLFFRDLYDPDTNINAEGAGWTKLLLSNGSMRVVNNLSSDDPNAVLSANMGRYLKKLIDEDSVGGNNMLMASGRKDTFYNPSTFMTVWKQRIRDNASSDFTDSSVQGNLLFNFDGSTIEGKIANFTEEAPFDPKKYFRNYVDNDYITIDTSNTGRVADPYHPSQFNAAGTYAYVTNDAYDGVVLPTDNAYTASMWVKLLSNASDDNTSSIFIELWLCTTKTVGGVETHIQVPVDLVFVNEQGFETFEESDDTVARCVYTRVATDLTTKKSNFPINKWVRVTATIDGVRDVYVQGKDGAAVYTEDGMPTDEVYTFDTTHVKVAFGIKGNAKAQFKEIKLERGKVPTDGSETLAEMWEEFDNANFLRMVPIDSEVRQDSLDEKEGLVFKIDEDETDGRGRWIKRHLATGGGGGFVVQSWPPQETEVLWYVHTAPGEETNSTIVPIGNGDNPWEVKDYYTALMQNHDFVYVTDTGAVIPIYEDAFYFFDENGEMGAGWYPMDPIFEQRDTHPVNKRRFWINTNNGKYNADESPDLYFYDTTYNRWRIVGAEARPSWVIQDTPPEAPDDDLMWITTSGIASVPYRRPDGVKIWLPIQAIWGNND